MEWQPIETAPKCEDVLVYWKEIFEIVDDKEICNHEMRVACYQMEGDVMCWTISNKNAGDTYVLEGEPTHWMPLPSPPLTEK